MLTLQTVIDEILDVRSSIPSQRSVLTAISEIDGCGKGYVTAWIVDQLQTKGVRAVAINVDGWLNLPNRRFDASDRPSIFTFMRSASRRCSHNLSFRYATNVPYGP